MHHLSALLLSLGAGYVLAQGQSIPNTWPHDYPGKPSGDFSPQWQDYFEVKDSLPNVTIPLTRSFAGNIPVNRTGHPNDTLFFWAFEKQNGSLTAPGNERNDDPWIIWLQGGPGSSGMLGFTEENGPLRIQPNFTFIANNFSWNTLADTFWIDQPVGTGWSTADSTGYVADEDQTGEDFLGFLSNVIKVFPSLGTRPLYLTGESYAGTYIPYITKHIFSTPSPPVKLRKIAIGDGSLGSLATIRELPTLNIIETYPQLINYDPEVFNYFKEQEHLCGFDLNLTYPQTGGNFPTLFIEPGPAQSSAESLLLESESRYAGLSWKGRIAKKIQDKQAEGSVTLQTRHRKREEWKRDLTGRPNGTIDPFYGCDLFDEMVDYALNFSFPWTNGGFDVYDIPDGTHPEPPLNARPFFNDDRTRAAIHAPTSKNWSSSFSYPFGNVHNRAAGLPSNQHGDPSIEPVVFLSELASNASANNVSIIFYSGNDDAQVQHRGTEVIIQNFTFGGIQGFTKKPSTPWFDDDGNFAGIVHQERNLTFVLFTGAGHLVPEWKPAAALVFLREFVLGNNETGLLLGNDTIGGENSTLANDVLPGDGLLYYGSATTSGTYTVPAATIASWESFITTATAQVLNTSSGTITLSSLLHLTVLVVMTYAVLLV